MEQVITPNPNVPCTPGYCLVYGQTAFGVGPKYSTATAAWNASQTKHQDQNWPALWFLVWFSVNGNPAGHVAIHVPDHSIYSSSSPTSHTPVHHASLAAMQSYWGKGTMLTYLGWTEDVEGTIVIKPKEEDIMDTNDGIEAYRVALHREPESTAAAAQWDGKKFSDIANSDIRSSAEWKEQDRRLKTYDALLAQVSDLTKQLQELQAASDYVPLGQEVFIAKK